MIRDDEVRERLLRLAGEKDLTLDVVTRMCRTAELLLSKKQMHQLQEEQAVETIQRRPEKKTI